MCLVNNDAPDAPPPPPKIPEAAQAPKVATKRTAHRATDKARRRLAAGESARSTILTSARGVTGDGNTLNKTLLGQ